MDASRGGAVVVAGMIGLTALTGVAAAASGHGQGNGNGDGHGKGAKHGQHRERERRRHDQRSACDNGSTDALGGAVDAKVQPSGASTLVACNRGTGAADVGINAGMNTATGQGYAVYQGRPGDAVPPGYVGLDTQNGVTIVGCDTGTYNPNAPDEWNQSPSSANNNAQIALGTDEFTAPTGPIGPGDPCSPFVPHTPPGRSCGSPQAAAPSAKYPGDPSPLNAYSAGGPADGTQSGQTGIAGDFGGGDGASGYLQATYGPGGSTPTGNVTTGGNSRGGGGTVAVGNDGNETDDPYTPPGSPVVVCQN